MSTMNKKRIKALAVTGKLIRSGFDESKIREACYEASTSNDFFEITSSGTKKITIAVRVFREGYSGDSVFY